MFYFTTYFDKNYLTRGLVLYDSIKAHCERFTIFILCLDEFTLDYFLKNAGEFPEVIILTLTELEEFDSELAECKTNRIRIEYYFTLSPCLPLYIIKKYNPDHICSLDADIMFFSSPSKIFALLENYSILITPHNFSGALSNFEIHGIYNVSFQVFKNDKNGIWCLEKWRKQCINWCYDKLEDGKYADQKYLDDWVTTIDGVSPIEIPGSGVAPWNIDSCNWEWFDNNVYINNDRLIFYHFHGLRVIGKDLTSLGLKYYNVASSETISKFIYEPYIRKLLSYSLRYDSEIQRTGIKSRSALKTILFEKDWLYFNGRKFIRSNIFIQLMGKGILFIKEKLI